MIKAKTKQKITGYFELVGSILTVILLIIAIFLVIGTLTGKFSLLDVKNYFGGDDMVPTPDNIEIPVPEEDSCSDYNIPEKYRETYGNFYINSFQANCETGGGVWREYNNEMGCYWESGTGVVDCSSQAVEALENYCVDGLLAKWTCDNTIAYAGCLCNKAVPHGFVPEPDPEIEEFTACVDVQLPSFGDLGGICSAEGTCGEDDSCSHYWDYINQEHKCSCSESFYCGQYCYDYFYTNGCECPPNSYKKLTSRSTFMCIPDGHYCEDGNPVEEAGVE